MRDTGKIVIGLIIFLLLMTFPIWYDVVKGVAPMQDPEILTKNVPGKDRCVRPVEYMRPFHMDLLNQWRDEVVRQGDRFTEGPYGERIEKSLTNTCLDCHSNKEDFCDRCHNAMAVAPYCWNCHVTPSEASESALAISPTAEEGR